MAAAAAAAATAIATAVAIAIAIATAFSMMTTGRLARTSLGVAARRDEQTDQFWSAHESTE